MRARTLWQQLTKENPSLVSVGVMDLVSWTKIVPQSFPNKPAVADIGGYDAWTNSSTLVLVAPSLFNKGIQDKALTDEVAKILLRHEAKHVDQFRTTGDRPPGSYQVMAVFEAQAYAQTKDELDKLAGQNAAWKDVATQFASTIKGVADDFAAYMTKSPDSAVRDAMVGKDYIPKSSPLNPAGLYVP